MEGDSIVISGISCRLPGSNTDVNNVEEFKQNLREERDMVTHRKHTQDTDYSVIPFCSGTIGDLSKFDAGFFGVPPLLADVLDPQSRLLLEVTYEAIVDGGISTEAFRGSNTGVFIGCGLSEALEAHSSDPDHVNAYGPIGSSSCMLANRISFTYNLRGPSYAIKNGNGTGFLALETAIMNIQQGKCEAAIVGACNLCMKSAVFIQLMMLDILSPDGKCRYCDENKSFYPSYEEETKFLKEIYEEANIDPAQVGYIEMSGSCHMEGDIQEVNSIVDMFCKNRETPLMTGSVKTNLGNTETVSGLVSILKVLTAAQEGMMPANLHVHSLNQSIPAFQDERINFLTERTRWTPGIVGINCYGMGHVNGHCILDFTQNPSDSDASGKSQEKRLVAFTSTTEQGVSLVLKHMRNHSDDLALHSLLNENSKRPPAQHLHRGYTVLNSSKCEEVQKCVNTDRPLWFVFSGMGSQWTSMGRRMMQFEVFQQSIMSCDAILQCYGVSLYDIIMEGGDEIYDECLNSYLGIISIQIALVDMLRSLGLEPDGMIGHSVGELGCGYADGSLTAEETMLAAYWRGKCIMDAELPLGGMAAVGLTWKEAKEQCPRGVVPACHNGENNVTISGDFIEVQYFIQDLKERGVFAKEIYCSGVAFHSPYMKRVAPRIKEKLKEVIVPKTRSKKWISSSIPESDWSTELAQTVSADYIAHNVLHPVLFLEALRHIPDGAVVLEVAPHCLLQGLIKTPLGSNCTVLPLMKRDQDDNRDLFLHNIGRCFNQGININTLGMCKPPNFPVPLSTPNLSSYIRWDHGASWQIPQPEEFLSGQSGQQTEAVFEIDVSPKGRDHYLLDHCIDGRALFPASGYLVLGWKILAKSMGQVYDRMSVLFRSVTIHRSTVLPSTGVIRFNVSIVPVTGEFEVCERDTLVASGEVFCPHRPLRTFNDEIEYTLSPKPQHAQLAMTLEEVYREFRLRGYEYGPKFCGILKATESGDEGYLLWERNWVTFLDNLMQMNHLRQPPKHLVFPTEIKYLSINPVRHKDKVLPLGDSNKCGVLATVNRFADTTVSGGIEMQGLVLKRAPVRKACEAPILEEYVHVPYYEEGSDALVSESLQKYCQLCVEQVKQVHKKLQDMGMAKQGDSLPSSSEEDSIDDEQRNDLKDFSEGKNCSLLQTLLKLNSVEPNEKFMTNVRNVFSAFKEDFLHDRLLSNHLQARSLKTCLDVVIENSANPLKVLEVQMVGPGLYTPVVDFLKVSPGLQYIYSVAGASREKEMESEAREKEMESEAREKEMESEAREKEMESEAREKEMESEAREKEMESEAREKEMESEAREKEMESEAPKVGTDSILWDIQEMFKGEQEYDLVIASNVFREHSNMEEAVVENIKQVVKENGFLLVMEITHNEILFDTLDIINSELKQDAEGPQHKTCTQWEELFVRAGFCLVAKKSDGLLMTTFLLRKMSKDVKGTILSLDGSHNSWLNRLKEKMAAVKKSATHRLWLTTNSPKPSGIIGLVNCLRRELGGERVRCIYNMDQRTTLTKVSEELKRKDLVMNIFKGGHWGSYRHIPVANGQQMFKKSERSFLTQSDDGYVWRELPAQSVEENEELCCVHYAALNTQDLNRDQREQGLGSEFSGVTSTGRRVMGLHYPAVATTAVVEKRFLVDVPEDWSLREASCVLGAYGIAIKALVVEEKVCEGSSVLIYDGHTDIGIAAVSVAINLKCDVFVTVPSTLKKNYLQSWFEELNPSQVLVVEDNSMAKFEALRLTCGQGIDLVVRTTVASSSSFDSGVLSPGGKVIDITQNKFQKNLIRISTYMEHQRWNLADMKQEDFDVIWEDLSPGIKTGAYKPIPNHCFQCSDIQRAMEDLVLMKGHHSKIVIKIRDEEDQTSQAAPVAKTVKITSMCNPDKLYIITGGLGGFGLELATWLADKGARKLILVSRFGIKTGYQARKVKFLREQKIMVRVSTEDITSERGCRRLIEQAMERGPVGGIFHLAVVLHDGMLKNQSNKSFKDVLDPKVMGLIHLDKWSRTLCRHLEWFTVFSSMTSGRGNAGQTNYGYANSLMERICEQRQANGHPALAIQWGMIGDVGVAVQKFGDNVTAVGRTLPQRMSSCLDSLDQFLCQSKPVVSSFVSASVSMKTGTYEKQQTLMEYIVKVLGLQDPAALRPESTLLELCTDSLLETEIQQIMKSQFNIDLSLPNLMKLTVQKIREMSEERSESKTPTDSSIDESKDDDDDADTLKEAEKPSWFTVPQDCFVQLSTGQEDKSPVIILHDLDGCIGSWSLLGKFLDNPLYGVHCIPTAPLVSIRAMAGFYTKKLAPLLGKGCCLLGVSFGSLLALHIAKNVATYWKSGCKVVAVDSSPEILTSLGGQTLTELRGLDPSVCDDVILKSFHQHIGLDKHAYQVENSLDDKFRSTVSVILEEGLACSAPDVLYTLQNYHKRAMNSIQNQSPAIDSEVILIRPQKLQFEFCQENNDYNWSEFSSGNVTVHTVNCSHDELGRDEKSIREVAAILNMLVNADSVIEHL